MAKQEEKTATDNNDKAARDPKDKTDKTYENRALGSLNRARKALFDAEKDGDPAAQAQFYLTQANVFATLALADTLKREPSITE